MKNYKNILLVSVSVIALNSHVIQTYDDSALNRFLNAFTDLFSKSEYENFLDQFRNDLRGIPQKDIDSIIFIARQKLITKKPENDYQINQLMREAITDQVRTITITMAECYTYNQKEIDASVQSMVGNVKARLNRGDNLNGLALKQFFDRNSLKKLVQQNVNEPYTSQPTYTKPVCSPQPAYPPQQQIYCPQSVPKFTPVKPSNPTVDHVSYNDYLEQLKHDLKGIPTSKIGTIVVMSRQELLRQKPTNDRKKIDIMCEAVINCVRIDTRAIASKLTNDQTAVNNTVQSMSGNVKARLAQGDNLNGQALAQFFGSSLEYMVKQNIKSTKKVDAPKPAPEKFAPSAPPAPFAPSAPEESNQEKGECCICFEDTVIRNIPCSNKHSDKICFSCVSQLADCPMCRKTLIK